jgi:iron complex outermembrane receptor protein
MTPRLLPRLFCVCALLAPLARAQSPAPSPAKADAEVAVLPVFVVNTSGDRGYYSTNSISGTKVNTPLMDLPVSMQVFTEEFLNDINAGDISDIFIYSSNVSTGNAPATLDGETNQPFMRGLQGGLVQRNGNRRLRVAAAANMERVEVLKGPSSLLYGQIEPGGIVNYITKRPTPRAHTSIRQNFGSFNSYRTVFDANLPLVEKKLGFRMVGMMSEAGNSIDFMETNSYQFNPVMTWWIRPKTQLTVEYDITSREVRGQRIGLPQDPTALTNYTAYPWAKNITPSFNMANPDGIFDEAIELYAADFQSELSRNFTVRANYSHSVREGSKSRVGATSITGTNKDRLNRSATRQDVRQPEEWLQLNLYNTFEVAGITVKNLFGYEDKYDEFQNNLTASVAASFQPQWDLNDPSTWLHKTPNFPSDWVIGATTGRRVRTESTSYFFSNQLSFFKGKVHTLAGVRRDDVKATLTDVGKTPVVSQYPISNTPQAGIVIKPWESVAFYASYSESFIPQFAGQKQRPDASYFTPDPFTGEGIDVGVKFEFLESRVAGTVAFFQLENTNQLQQLPNQIDPATGAQFTPWLQDGAVDRSEGFEVDLRLMPFKGTQVVAAYGHMNAYHKKDVNTPSKVGLALADAPANTFSLFVKQNLGKFAAFENIWLTGGARFVDDRAAALVVGSWTMESYWTTTLGINAQIKREKVSYSVGVSVQNLFDELYRADVHSFGAPRTYNLTLGVSF